MLKPILCDYSDAYMLKSYAPFTDCIKSTQVHNAEHIDVVIPMYNLIEYSDNYSKISGSSSQCYGDEPVLNSGVIAEFNDNNTSDLVKFKENIMGKTCNKDTKDVEIMVPLKYISNFGKPFTRR